MKLLVFRKACGYTKKEYHNVGSVQQARKMADTQFKGLRVKIIYDKDVKDCCLKDGIKFMVNLSNKPKGVIKY